MKLNGKSSRRFLASGIVATALVTSMVRPCANPVALAATKAVHTTVTAEQLETMYQAISSVPQTPKAFVIAYLHAIGTGSGLYARAFLAKNIQDQLPAGHIASAGNEVPVHPWLVHSSVKLIDRHMKGMNAENTLDVIAFAAEPKTGNLISVFRDKLTVTSTNVASPLNDTPPYVITAQSITWLHPHVWSHF